MLTGIRKLNVFPSRLTALALLAVVAITLLNACGGGDSGSGDDSGEDSPMMMVMPILRTITTPPAPSSTQKLEVLDDGTHQNMEFDASKMPQFDTLTPTGRTYTATSSAPDVATASVDTDGVATVTAVKRGSADITITADGVAVSTLTRSVSAPSIRAAAAYSFKVEVGNRAPTVVGTIAALALNVGLPETLDVASNFNDPDKESMIYTTSSSASAVATVTIDDNVVTVTPVAVGSTTITVTAQDPGGLSATQTIAVTVAANQAPMAVGTVAALTFTFGDSAATRDVASNFSDPDNDPLTYTLSSSDSDVATATVSGSVVTVTPIVGGSATITVTAQDSDGFSATQTIAVTVNTAPVAVGTVAAVTLTEGDSAATRDVASNFNDPDNDSLTYTASSSAPAVATVSVSGSVVTVTPVVGGSTTITVTAQDPGGLSATQTIAVTIAANQVPTAVGTVAALTFTFGDSAATRDVASNFSDPDNDPLTYTAITSDSDVATATVSGSVVTVTPITGGSATITVTAQDSDGFSATQTIAVTVNTAPVAVGTVAAVTLIAGRFAATRDVASNFNDPDNDSLTYTVSSSAPAVATVSVSGSVVTVTPVVGGSTTITVTAQDPGGLSTTQTIAVTVAANQAPMAVGTVAALTFTFGDSAATRDVASNFSDPDNDPLTYTVSSSDSDVATATVSGSVVTVTPIVGGSATITVTAQDSDGLSATQTIAVTVNTAPVAVGTVAAVTLTEGDSAATRDVASNFNDPDNDSLTRTRRIGQGVVVRVAEVGCNISGCGRIPKSERQRGDRAYCRRRLVGGYRDRDGLGRTQAAGVLRGHRNGGATTHYRCHRDHAAAHADCGNGRG